MADWHELSLSEIAAAMRAREASPVAVTEAMLGRIDQLDPQLRAYVHRMADVALAQARAAEAELARGEVRGPLHGVPIALKDLLATADAPTRAGTTVLTSWSAGQDAEVVARLRRAGAVFLGKVKTTEGAYATHHPAVAPPVNPWGASIWTGVSSSGSGVAVAGRLAFGAIGTDTGGSIRFPSHCCGVVGLKPTWGRVSRRGVFPLAESLDHVGPIARSVADVAAIFDAIAGPDPGDPTTLGAPPPDCVGALAAGARGLRVGFDEAYCGDGLDARVASMLRDARDALREAGAELRPIAVPPRDAVAASWAVLCAAETALAHDATYPSRKAEYGPGLAALLELGHAASARDYARAHQERLRFAGALARVFEEVDLLLSPTWRWTSRTTAEIDAALGSGDVADVIAYTAPYDASGSPTLSLPGGFDEQGAPFGFQLVGRQLGEDLLCRAGHAYQQRTDWHRRSP